MESLRIRLLGELEVDGVPLADLGSRKARTLVRILALGRGATVGVSAITEALWPGSEVPAKPVEQVGVLVSRLRSVLGPERFRRTDAGWSLAVDWLDVIELEVRVREATARLDAHNPGAARSAARAALDLVRGDLLADEPDAPWAEADRANVGRLIMRARLIGAEAALAANDPIDAAAVAEGLLDHDGYDEAALRVLMRAHAAAGRPASALAAYAKVRGRLIEDLGVDPDQETEALHTAVLLGELEPVAAGPPSAPVPLAGRSAEWAALDGALERASRGAAVMASIEGEAGIGKTMLVTRWADAHRPGALVITGRCDELGRDLPLQPLLDGLEAHLRSLDPDAADDVVGDAASVIGPLLGRFSSEGTEPTPTTVSDPAAGQALLFASLLSAFERAAQGRPLVIVVEDVHQAGASTIEWLRFATRRSTRLLVVTTQRPGGPTSPGSGLIAVGPLTVDAVAQLVGDERAVELHARSGGHPLFLQELARASTGELPASVRESVAARVGELGEAAVTLQTAAILGSDVDVDVLAGTLEVSVAVLLEHIDAGLEAMVLVEHAGALAFRHELLREALVADATAARQAFVHRKVARLLRGRPGHDPMEVAWHARAGGDADLAVAALIDAAATASSRFAVAAAEQLLSEAIDLVDGVPARLARARLRIATWDPTGAEADVARAIELGAGAAGLEVAAWVAYYQRDYERAHRYASEAVARSDDDGLRASCLAMSGRVLHASGDLRGAAAALDLAMGRGQASVRGLAQAWLGCLRVHQGDPAQGEVLVDLALVEGLWLGHPFAGLHALMFRAIALGQQGEVDAAFRAVDSTQQAAFAWGQQGDRFVAVADNIRSWLLRGVGALPEAEDATQAALDRVGDEVTMEMSEPRGAALLDRFDNRLLAADLAGAEAAARAAEGIRQATGTMMWHHRQRYHVLGARLALASGSPDTALELALVAAADAGERGSPRYGALAAAVAAQAHLALGTPVDHDELDRTLATLDRCAGLEAWRATAELAAASGLERLWRDADRRAGALVARAGERGEELRRTIAATFSALGR